MSDKKYVKLDAEGETYPIDEEKKSVILNGKEYFLADDVWYFILCLESEKEYFRKKYMALTDPIREKVLIN